MLAGGKEDAASLPCGGGGGGGGPAPRKPGASARPGLEPDSGCQHPMPRTLPRAEPGRVGEPQLRRGAPHQVCCCWSAGSWRREGSGARLFTLAAAASSKENLLSSFGSAGRQWM